MRTILSQTPSHLNVTASADQGSPVSAPTISQTSVKGNLNINQNCKLRTCQSEVYIYIYIYIYITAVICKTNVFYVISFHLLKIMLCLFSYSVLAESL